MKIFDLSTGDAVYRYEKSIVVFFGGKRKVLSTSVYNGGYSENMKTIFNRDGTRGAGMASELLAPTYDEHMRIIARQIGLDPETATGMGTAACMDNVAIHSLRYEDLVVTALVTGGIETNGGRVGDPAAHYKLLAKPEKPGTINIMLIIDADLPPGTLARALVTCTEAKTAAIQELLEGSKYSNGIATGSGTDQTIVVANAESPLYLEGAGKHSKLGELIGRVVLKAVKEALSKQSGLNPESQHDVLRRFKRFGVTAQTLWAKYQQAAKKDVLKPIFLENLAIVACSGGILTYTSLYIHLMDQFLWGLLSSVEVADAGNQLLKLMSEKEALEEEFVLERGDVKECVQVWEDLLVNIIVKRTGQFEVLA